MTAIPQLLADLVRLPSVNPMGRTVESPLFYEDRVTDYLEQFFRRIGVPYERQSVLPQRSNIVARYEPAEPTCTILWEVHQDTVPVDAMTIDPFGGIIDKGKLYGRGACDVKGSMSAMLFALERLARERPAKSARVIANTAVSPRSPSAFRRSCRRVASWIKATRGGTAALRRFLLSQRIVKRSARK